MRREILAGALAGAAGTTALNAVTYLDMALRGRPASSTPEQSVQKLADSLQVGIPGQGDARENRLSGLGALGGLLTGASVGALYGAVTCLLGRPSLGWGSLLAGGSAMVGANGPMALSGLTDPRSWSAADWLSDLVPHAAYGLVTALAYEIATEQDAQARPRRGVSSR
jgi:hypothetical protein